MIQLFYIFPTLAYACLTLLLGLNRRHKIQSVCLLAVTIITLIYVSMPLWGVEAWSFGAYLNEGLDFLRLSAWCFFLLSIILDLNPDFFRVWSFKRSLLSVGFALCLSLAVLPFLMSNFMFFQSSGFSLILVLKILWIVYGLVLIECIFRQSNREILYLLKYILLGIATTHIYDLAYNSNALLFGNYELNLTLARYFIFGMVVPLIAISAARYKQWSTNLRISRQFVFHSAVLSFAGLYLILISVLGYYINHLQTDFATSFQIIFIVSAILLMTLAFFSEALRVKVRVLISRNFFAYRYDYREEWARFIQAIAQQDISHYEKYIRAMGQIVESESGVLWVLSEEEKNLQIRACLKFPKDLPFIPLNHPFIKKIEENPWILNLKVHQEKQRELLEILPKWIWDLKSARFLVPLLHRDKIYGLMLIGDPLSEIDVTWETYLLLKTVSYQVSSYLAEEITRESLFHAEQLQAFNKRFAFVIHDLKNLINQLSLTVVNAEKYGDKKEFRDDMLTTLRHSVDKMKDMLTQLKSDSVAEFSQHVQVTNKGKQTEVSKQNVIDDLAVFIEKWADQRVPLHFQKPKLSKAFLNGMIMWDRESFFTALQHLIQNAIEATVQAGRVSPIHIIVKDENGQLEINVEDSGTGMSDQFIAKDLFKPLQSTKEGGYGIGAYQARELLKEMGFELSVTSKLGEGTQMKVLLTDSIA
jgi:putative PEP-CTERM system histidine kinase